MKNILIYGGAGFVGSHLVRRLLALPETECVVVVDNLSSGRYENLSDLEHHHRFYFYQHAAEDFYRWYGGADKPKRDGFEPIFQFDTAFHLASNADIARAATEPTIDFEQGTALTQQVLEDCRTHKIPRLIYFSGSGVYGQNTGEIFSEDYGPCMPISTYGASKLAGEAMVCAYCHMFGLSALAFRFANIVGARQTHGVGFDFMRRLKEDPAHLRIMGDGQQIKSYLDVDDAINAVLLANAKHEKGFDAFNVATTSRLTVTQIAKLAIEARGLEVANVRIEYEGGQKGWAGDVPDIRLDATKMVGIGWYPKKGSIEAMRDALETMK